MKQSVWLFLVTIVFWNHSNAQTRYVIKFKDKGYSPFSIGTPAAYLSQRAIDRRTRYSIRIDSADLPVTPRYLDSIRSAGAVTVLNVSKWLNQVSVQTTDAAALNKIKSFPFVVTAAPIAERISSQGEKRDKFFPEGEHYPVTQRLEGTQDDYYNYGNSFGQIHIHNADFLHNIGLHGEDMIIGMLDAGYYHYTSLHAFDSMNANGQVLGTWDFVNRKQSVVEEYYHGMECLSTMAANIPGMFVGMSPKAHFYLFKTEDINSEYPIEEHNWVCGAEKIDSAGGDVISSSLGYFTFDDPSFNHTYADMNGHTTIAAIGAGIAAKKGLIVVNAAGNEGTDSWHYIITPADGDSVLAVGAVDVNGQVGNFSSYGPSSDGRVKPDVAAVGVAAVVQNTDNTIGFGYGTSFACPNMAGLATCLWQGFREFDNMKIFNALRQSGSKATTPDNRTGYGIPDAKKALILLLKQFATATATQNNCAATLTWTSKDMRAMKYEIERKTPSDTAFVKIGEHFGTGDVFFNQTYQFTDSLNGITTGNIAYRIRQIVDTAAATFAADYIASATVALKNSCIITGTDIRIMPNPARNMVQLKIATTGAIDHLQIRIVSINGQTVDVINTSKNAGITIIDIPVAGLAAGKYFVSVYSNNQLIGTRPLIKL